MLLSLFDEDSDLRKFNEDKLHKLEGLSVIYDFISKDEQNGLFTIIDTQPWLNDLSRRVQHYGYKYDYKSRKIDDAMYLGNLPEWLAAIALKMQKKKLIDFVPDQAIINEYLPGQGIAPHIDCEPCFSDTIISLSLGSSAVMNFEKLPNSKEKMEILLEPRSLIIMQGDSRFKYYHSIPARKKDLISSCTLQRGRRISVTFRKVIK